MLLFESELSKYYYDERPSSEIVISFAHLDYDHTKDQYWGQDVFAKLGYASIGVVAKGNNWFPTHDFMSFAPFLRKITDRFQKRIVYGFSMGAYAALKFSRPLSADTVISLSPQYSIAPEDVWNADGRLVHLYRPELNSGMAIRPEDVAGDVFIFFDPHERQDVWNVDRIAEVYPSLKRIRVPYVGHETIGVLTGTEAVGQFIKLCLASDVAGIERLAAILRRRTSRRTIGVAEAALDRHPHWATAIFEQYCQELPAPWKARWTSKYNRLRDLSLA